MRLAILITFLISVILFENCGSTGGGGSSFSVNTATSSSTGYVALTASPIFLPVVTSLPVNSAIAPTSTISGSNLTTVTCTWNIVNSSNTPVVTPSIGVYNTAGSFCSGALVTPATSGTYGVTLTVTNSGGETSTNMITISVAGPILDPTPNPTPNPTAAPTPPPSGASCTFNGTTIANGGSVTAFLAGSCPCISQLRTCSDGVLSGSYTSASCKVYKGGCP